jgi:TadE-like protein
MARAPILSPSDADPKTHNCVSNRRASFPQALEAPRISGESRHEWNSCPSRKHLDRISSGASGTRALPFIENLADERGSALLEFALVLPLLVVFVVGIFDFSGAFNQKQKVAQAAQEGAILAAAQPMSDIVANGAAPPNNPDSLQADVAAIFDSLAGSGVLPNANQGSCGPPFAPSGQSLLQWTYTIGGCAGGTSSDSLVIAINRGWVSGAHSASGSLSSVGTSVTVTYPYHWRFNGVIQLLFPGANYSATTPVTETAIVHNQT